jgi:hypothetical protein
MCVKVCGGGPKFAIWHLRSLKPMSIQEFDNELFVPNACRIYDNKVSFFLNTTIAVLAMFSLDKAAQKLTISPTLLLSSIEIKIERCFFNIGYKIITGGNQDRVFFNTFDNKPINEIKTSTKCVYDISINSSMKSNRILGVSGAGNSIDICSNFTYKALTLSI